ncbi:MAG: TRAP transporter small permease [Planctomycetaceae bacterium]|nr:TRAP transporter small permease [Planctomycetaceae bacterium]
MRIFDWLDSAVRFIASILMLAMTGLVLLEVVSRYAFNRPLGATQELSVMCMVWIAMLGTATAIKSRSHVSITFLVNALPPLGRRVAGLVSNLVMLALFYLMVSYGWTVVVRGMRQASTVTGIRHGYVALAVPVCGILCLLYLLDMMVFRRTRIEAASDSEPSEEPPHA